MDFKTRYQYNSKTDLLGRGGFATVYKANDTLLDRVVALKFFTQSGDGKHTLIQEISRAISLEHPNLCRYYDAAVLEFTNLHGETERTEVGVMEYIDSGDMKYYTRQFSFQLDKLLIDVLRGLGYLHKRGIIHRDLKPQNILIKTTEDGPLAKITDFGISKLMGSGNTGSSSQLMGTVEYMAPEQFSPAKYGINGKISTNLDIWSFGLMVYELVLGETMFGSRGGDSSAEQVMSNILNDNLVEEKIKRLPEAYQGLVNRCLIKDAKQRAQSAEELIALLNAKNQETIKEVQNTETRVISKKPVVKKDAPTVAITPSAAPPTEKEPAKQEPPKPSGKNYVGAIVITALAIVGIGLWLHFKGSATDPPKGDQDYIYAMQHYGDSTTDFLPRLASSANHGNDTARFKLSEYYYTKGFYDKALEALGPLVNKNQSAAIRLQDSCQYETGFALYNEKKLSRAFEWFDKAAISGNAKAQCMIGTMYFQGQGVAKSPSEALKWYLKSADQENEVAMYTLGLIYADGIGVEKNNVEAKKYFNWVIKNAKREDVVKTATAKLASLQ